MKLPRMPLKEKIRWGIILANATFWLFILLLVDARVAPPAPTSYVDMVIVSAMLPSLSAFVSEQCMIGAYLRKAVKSLAVILLLGSIAATVAYVWHLALSPTLVTDWDIYFAIAGILLFPVIEMVWECWDDVSWKHAIIAPPWKSWK